MPDSAPVVYQLYQLKVVLQGISPMIWRRLLVQSENTIADLHYVIQIPKISPVLVVVGKSDIATRPFASEHMSKEVPQAELSVLSPGGHMALMEHNQQFAEVVRTFSHSCFLRK